MRGSNLFNNSINETMLELESEVHPPGSRSTEKEWLFPQSIRPDNLVRVTDLGQYRIIKDLGGTIFNNKIMKKKRKKKRKRRS